ncbi:MAG TPA: 6-phosphogluconolactonase [Myxococcales bacterium]
MADRRIVVAADPPAEAGALLCRELSRFERPRLAIPGGSAARALAGLPARLGAGRWSKVRLTWVDERCVPVGDRASNRGEAYRAGLLERGQPPAMVLPLFEDGESPESACARVLGALKDHFDSGIDVALLGMGEDGHLASLFPGRTVAGEVVAAVHDSPKPPPQRITLTLPMLRTARSSILLAMGEGKRAALKRLLDGDPTLPGSALESVVIVTDLGGLR